MGASIEVDISDLSEEAVRRLLRDAVRQQAINSMPAGKRGAAKQDAKTCEYCGEPMDECDCDPSELEEMDAKVEMDRSATSGKANIPDVKTEDLPRGMNMKKYAKAKGSKNGVDNK